MTRLRLAAALLALAPGSLAAPSSAAPSADASAVEGLSSRADVTGPRGTYRLQMVTLADGRAWLAQVRASGVDELLAVGDRAWDLERKADGTSTWVAADPAMVAFARGHDVPRLAARAAGAPGEPPAKIVVERPAALGGTPIDVELGDWRNVAGTLLPHAATFVDAARDGERHALAYQAADKPMISGESWSRSSC